MKIVYLKCPSCNANIDIEDGIDTFYCKYCGTRIILDGLSKDSINAKIRIKEFEHVERIKDKEFAQERFRIKFEAYKSFLPMLGLGAICFLLLGGAWISSRSQVMRLEKLSKEIEADYNAGDYDSALMKANRLRYDSDWSDDEERAWDARREKYIEMIEEAIKKEEMNNENNVRIPQSSNALKGKKYQDVVSTFSSAGFKNIETVALPEDNRKKKKKGIVDHISIDGKESFTSEEYFSKNAKIIIYYYPD